MVIFGTNKKNTEKKKTWENCLHEDELGKKKENFSYPSSVQKNNDSSLR